MLNDIIDNPKSGRIRTLAGLHRKKQRLEAGLFLVEGPQAVFELVTHEPERVDTVFIAYDTDGFPEIEHTADRAGITTRLATREVLAALSDTVTPQGVVAVARITKTPLNSALEGARLVAVCHEIRDPGNAGTVVRAADAAGADAVIFAGESIDPWNPKVVRSTTGSLFHLPVVTGVSLETVVTALRERGITSIAADVQGTEITPHDEVLRGPVAWVFGNEARGLSPEDRDLADLTRRLPLYGKAESLNLATAASVCLYTTAFAQRG